MKINKLTLLILVIVTSICYMACVEDGDFTVPKDLGNETNKKLDKILDSINTNQLELKSISEVKALYISGDDPLQIASNIVVKGYVVSSDQSGNYFREFYIQDKPENPTAGIKIALNLNDIYNKYNIGREVYIRLKGIYVGETNSGDGVIAIGGKIKHTDTREIEAITQSQEINHVFRSATVETIVPKVITLGGINKSENIGTFVKIENAFFSGNVEGKAFIDPTEDFDTKRKIEACQGLGLVTSLVETSSFADFANNSLPEGGGTISGVVTRDFGGDFTVLVLNNVNDVDMTGTKCTPSSIEDFTTTLLDENFDATSGDINISGWTNYKESGSESWESYFNTDISSRGARVGSFRSGDDSTISWLITKAIDLDTTSEEFLSFETSTSFADGSELEVLISTNWDGTEANIATATWEVLPAKIAADNGDFRAFVNSTYLDLSSYSGAAYIAFKYIGSGNEAFDGTYELDDVRIIAK